MVNQLLHEILANLPHVVALALALGVMIGVTGSAIEAVGMLAQRFPRTASVGVSLAHIGKLLEAYGTDIPKIVTNATGWVSKIAKLFGTASIFILAFGSLVLATSLGACGAAPTVAPCTPAVIAGIEARYTASVISECTQTNDAGEIVNPWGKIEDCPAIGSLLAKRRADEQAAACR